MTTIISARGWTWIVIVSALAVFWYYVIKLTFNLQ